jgi:hypothetical protein
MKTKLNQTFVPGDAKLKRTGITGIAAGVLALLACEIPIILAVLGLGGLSAGAAAFRPPPMVELAAIIVMVVGTLLLAVALTRRLRQRRRT